MRPILDLSAFPGVALADVADGSGNPSSAYAGGDGTVGLIVVEEYW